ncbi:MAG: hypothetical protein WB988_24515, partial [Candidatus Nitrosopolaris sp.]
VMLLSSSLGMNRVEKEEYVIRLYKENSSTREIAVVLFILPGVRIRVVPTSSILLTPYYPAVCTTRVSCWTPLKMAMTYWTQLRFIRMYPSCLIYLTCL